jgi:hypothetical protein
MKMKKLIGLVAGFFKQMFRDEFGEQAQNIMNKMLNEIPEQKIKS